MAITYFRVEGQITGQVTGPKTIRFDYTSTAGTIRDLNLATGSNSVTIPSGSEGIIFVPPSTNTVALTLKGVTGDTGVLLHATNPSIIAVSSSTTVCVISAATIVSNCQVIAF